MSEITKKVSELLQTNSGAPFLFIGSGFSRRYIGLEQWSDLLGKFCADIKEFGFYASETNSQLPQAAALIANDFNKVWWENEKYASSREKFKSLATTKASTLKYEISAYLSSKAHIKLDSAIIGDELKVLPRLNIDGIITTNWDLFLEELFPDYKVFIGQEELLFSNPQSVAEIYKIHGCASQPNSLILTQEDYDDFDKKNAYLAAKLITIFIEHPVIFIGYSLSDRNIQKIISSIVSCLGQDKLDHFGRNLIFLQRCNKSELPSFQPSTMTIGETNLSISVVRTDNFLDIYNAIDATKRKIPAKILRYCKEQMYTLVKETKPSVKLAVIDIDQIEEKEDIEFVIGVGVAELSDRLSKRGYIAVDLDDLFMDLLEEKSKLDANELLTSVYPRVFKRPNKYIPAYRYLREVNINNITELRASKYASIEDILVKSKGARYIGYRNQYDSQFRGKTTKEIFECAVPIKAMIMTHFQNENDIDIDAIANFLTLNKDNLKSGYSPNSSHFRKFACLYDRLKYGFSLE